MLVLSRKSGEKLVIGEGVTITVLDVSRGRVRLGVDAPFEVRVLRGELALAGKAEAADAESFRSPVSAGERHV